MTSPARDRAVDVLRHYFSSAYKATGLKWTSENALEVEQLADDLIMAATLAAKRGEE